MCATNSQLLANSVDQHAATWSGGALRCGDAMKHLVEPLQATETNRLLT
jgi:hypothetical protein